MGEIKPIETYYNGYRFRSRLEARWAVFFDSLNIPYLYEAEGLNINGITYLPDFYLPDSKQFFECKGIMSNLDQGKIDALISAGHSVIIGYDDGYFTACDYWGINPEEKRIYDLCTGSSSFLCQCRECGKYWFMGSNGIYTCECCGEYDGDHHFHIIMESYDYVNTWNGQHSKSNPPVEWGVARRARFEHGETPRFKSKPPGVSLFDDVGVVPF